MTKLDPKSSRRWRWWAWAILIFAILGLVSALCIVGFCLDTNHAEGVIVGATIGTALGTLALAGTTYGLARETRSTVQEAEAQLAELKKQGRVVGRQASATARLADSSKAAAVAAEKARIDATAPLVQCVARLAGFEVTDRNGAHQPTGSGTIWSAADVAGYTFKVTIRFEWINVGSGACSLFFPGIARNLNRVRDEDLSSFELEPGKRFVDHYIVTIDGGQAYGGVFVRMALDYVGVLHGEMSDTVIWTGWVVPVTDPQGGVLAQSDRLLNNTTAAVVRTYPNLEKPQEMADVRKQLLGD